jgi:SRP54-type protein, helical bundle domain
MVLNELGSRIGAALAAMSNATVIDEAVLDTCLKAICTALLQVLDFGPQVTASTHMCLLPDCIASGGSICAVEAVPCRLRIYHREL